MVNPLSHHEWNRCNSNSTHVNTTLHHMTIRQLRCHERSSRTMQVFLSDRCMDNNNITITSLLLLLQLGAVPHDGPYYYPYCFWQCLHLTMGTGATVTYTNNVICKKKNHTSTLCRPLQCFLKHKVHKSNGLTDRNIHRKNILSNVSPCSTAYML